MSTYDDLLAEYRQFWQARVQSRRGNLIRSWGGSNKIPAGWSFRHWRWLRVRPSQLIFIHSMKEDRGK